MSNYEKFYKKISAPWRRHPAGIRALNRINALLTATVYAAYPAFLVRLIWNRDERWGKAAAVPEIGRAHV